MSQVDEFFKEKITSYMEDIFYLQGENKDYYFGKSPLNDALTVFSNVGICDVLRQAINRAYDDFTAKYNLSKYSDCVVNLKDSAFKIDARTTTFKYQKYYDAPQILTYTINCMEKGVLEEAIRENPERWNLYLRKRA